MTVYLSNKEIIEKIAEYPNPSWIWIEIWEMSDSEIQIVATVNKEELLYLGGHKVIYCCSAQNSLVEDVINLKNYGKKLTRAIRRKFPDSEVHSRLYY